MMGWRLVVGGGGSRHQTSHLQCLGESHAVNGEGGTDGRVVTPGSDNLEHRRQQQQLYCVDNFVKTAVIKTYLRQKKKVLTF